MILLIDAEKAFDKVQHSFMIKTLSKVVMEGAFLKITKAIKRDLKPTSYLMGKKNPTNFPTEIRNNTRLSTFTISIQHSIGSHSHSNQTRKSNKRHPNWKGGNETVTVCRWHDSVHGKSYRLHQKTTRPNKWIWQNSRIQSQYSKIKGTFVYQQWNIRNGNLGKKIPFGIATRKKNT